MIYDLAGLARIGTDPTSSAFLVPFFRNRSSNQIFAQDLNLDHRISCFLMFDPYEYEVVNASIPPLIRSVGEIGVMAFVRRGCLPVVGNATEVLASLRRAKLSSDRSPFFEMDAYDLTGQTDLMRGALKRARRALGDGPIASRWIKTETSLLRDSGPIKSTDLLMEEINELASDFSREDWARRWTRLWRNVEIRDKIAALALNYLEHSNHPVSVTGRVVLPILLYNQRSNDYRAIQLARRWLAECARVLPIHHAWPRIWRILAATDGFLSPDMVSQGLAYLRKAAAAGRVTGEWTAVGTVLRGEILAREFSEEIFQLERELLLSRRIPASSLRPVIKSLVNEIPDPRSIEILESWIKSEILHTNGWIDAYISVLDNRGGDAEILRIGLKWLDTDPGRLRRWKQVYEAVNSHMGPSPALQSAACNWLIRANRSMTSWPEVATDMLVQTGDYAVKSAVKRWLEHNPRHPSADILTHLSRQDSSLSE